MNKSGFVCKIFTVLLAVALITIYSFSDTASLFATSDGGTTVSAGTKIDSSRQSYSFTGNWCVIKQASGTLILWTEDTVSEDVASKIKAAADAADGAIKGDESWVTITGFGKATPVDANNFGTYEFLSNSDGTTTLNVYDKDNGGNYILSAGKISHMIYGSYTKEETPKTPKGKIVLTKKVENGTGVNGTFYFKLIDSSKNQIGDLKSITVANGVVSGTVTWVDLEYGDYTIIETDKDGKALAKGDKTFGKELVDISNDNSTKVTLSATSPKASIDNIVWTEGTASDLFGAASDTNLLAFGNVSNVVDIEGNIAVAGDFTNSNKGFSVGSKNGNYSDEINFMAGGNVSINGYFTAWGHVVTGSGTFTTGGADYRITKGSYTAEGLKALYNATEVTDNTDYYLVRGATARVQDSKNQLSAYFTSAKTYMESLQTKLSGLTANGSVTDNGYGTITLKGSDADLNVFTVDLSGNKGKSDIEIDCPSTSTIIVNVTGKNITSGNPAWGSDALKQNTIFNFVDCETLTMGGSTAFYGSFLAPDMDLNVNGYGGNINGNTVVKNLTNSDSGFECHKYYYKNKLSAEAQAEITNTFADKDTARVQFGVTKNLDGREFKAGDAFTFDLYSGTDTSKDPIDSITTTATSGTSQSIDFKSISYDKEGTYTYTVKERIPKENAGGITYSDAAYRVTVTVSKSSDGKLLAEYSINDGTNQVDAASFTNTYSSAGEATINVKKILENKSLTAGQFTFELVQLDAQGNPVEGFTKLTAINDKDGNVTFPSLKYTSADAGNTYTYRISEVVPENKDGITYDTAKTVSVTVGSDNGTGKLDTKVNYPEKSDSQITFTNTYSASGSAKIEVNKVLKGKKLTAGQFAFELVQVDGNDNAVQSFTKLSATNDVNGKVSFGPINYTIADAGKTYTYRISEVIPDGAVNGIFNNIAYDTTPMYVTVSVTDNGKGTLATTINYPSLKTAFENKYGADGTVALSANKALSGATLYAGQFNFGVYSEGSTSPVSTGTNKADGTVQFSPISYKVEDLEGAESKTFTYEIRELSNLSAIASGMVYDTNTYKAVVTVTNDGGNSLKTSVKYYNKDGTMLESAPVFNNSYIERHYYTSRTVTKTWDDDNNYYGERPDSITVHLLKDGVVVDTQKITAASNWTYTWSQLDKFSGGQLINYSVIEDAVTDYTTSVSGGTDADGNGGSFYITNTYSGYKSLYVSRTVKKVWDDNNNSDGTRPDRVMVQLYANGVAAGDPVELNADTNWQYKWTELKAESQGQEITYTVKEISEFSNYTASYSDDTFTITNTKKDGGGGGNPSNNNSSGKSSNNAANLLAGPMTGDNANLVLPISAGLLAIIGLVVLLRIRKKNGNR